MAICNISSLSAFLAPRTCLLGIDPGRVVVGLAISDPARRVASPLQGLVRTKMAKDAAVLGTIVRERAVGGFIVGLPLNMDGTAGPATQAARTFISNLLRSGALPDPDLPIVFWDERFSSAAVSRFMIADDMSRKRRDETIDKAAAAYILQGALDALHNAPNASVSKE